ncbi:MAG: ABCB family ABC transporter ATP-binding protein/permease [Beijerinckiaceae bacterium]
MSINKGAEQTALATAQSTAQKPSVETGMVRTIIAIWPYLWPSDRRDLQIRVLIAFGLIIIAKLITITVPFTFKWATDALVAGQLAAQQAGQALPVQALNGWLPWLIGAPVAAAILYGLARVGMAVFQQLRDGVFAAVSMHAVRRLANQTFEHMHRLSLRFHLERKTGGLTRVLERGKHGIEELSRMALLTLFPTIFEFLLVCGVLLLQFDWRYVAVITVMIAVYLWFTVSATNWRINIRRQMNDSDTDANTKAVDSLLNFETVKYFGAEKRENARFDRSMATYEKASTKSYTSLAILNAGQAIIFTIGLTLCMAMSATDVLAGRNTIGDFVLVNAMLIQLYQPLNFMGMVYREIKQALVDIEKMFEVIATNAEVKDDPGARPLAVTTGAVSFKDVTFHYMPERPILKGISFDVPAGKTVAIVGPSGAGKSTISRLLFRFYDISSGSITIDGQDIREVTQVSLRDAIGMVPQDTVLFNDTILYNIAYGRDGATRPEIEEAARLAQIDRLITQLPEGYEAQVGERGLKLSGGEKQRVAIARTILKAPPILVLDEATSALDSHTEMEIQEALDSVSRNRTTIVIAHRLSTVINADEIIVLEKGVIAERGTHQVLLKKKGIYASMWNRQREADAARETLKRHAEAEGETVRVKLEG